MKVLKVMMCLMVGVILFSCSDQLGLDERNTNTTGEFDPSTGSTGWYDIPDFKPDPGRPGPYDVCFQEYSLTGIYDSDSKQNMGVIYYPVDFKEKCRITDGRFPFVVISHADGDGQGYNTYSNLMEQIASYGFVVMAYHRNFISADENAYNEGIGQDLFLNHFFYAYSSPNSPVAGSLSDNIALIGHSAGGATIKKVIQRPELSNYNIKSVILMSPIIYTGESDEIFDASVYSDSFLGFCNVDDEDMNAFGKKNDGEVMQTAFKDYDEFGMLNPNKPIVKDMVHFNMLLLNDDYPGFHYYENTSIAKSYITGFLLQHVKGYASQELYFKYQHMPVAVANDNNDLEIRQLHAESKELVLADFENKSADYSKNGSPISGNHISKAVYLSYMHDEYSPHHTRYMRIEWGAGDIIPQNYDPYLEFKLNKNSNPVSIGGFNSISFDLGQVFEGMEFPSDSDLDLEVILEDAGLNTSHIMLSDQGEDLKPPFDVQNHPSRTKNALQSFILPLSLFQGVDLNKIVSIKFKFPKDTGSKINIDNLVLN